MWWNVGLSLASKLTKPFSWIISLKSCEIQPNFYFLSPILNLSPDISQSSLTEDRYVKNRLYIDFRGVCLKYMR